MLSSASSHGDIMSPGPVGMPLGPMDLVSHKSRTNTFLPLAFTLVSASLRGWIFAVFFSVRAIDFGRRLLRIFFSGGGCMVFARRR